MLKKLIVCLMVLWGTMLGGSCGASEPLVLEEQIMPQNSLWFVDVEEEVEYSVIKGEAQIVLDDGVHKVLFDQLGHVMINAIIHCNEDERIGMLYCCNVIPLEEFQHLSGIATASEEAEMKYQEFAGDFETRILELVNQERMRVGARPLRIAYDLQSVANVRAQELRVRYDHTRPNGESCFSLVADKGRGLGENIAAGQDSPEAVVESWMNSPGHRDNMLNPQYREIGIGLCMQKDDPNGYYFYWVQLFRR